MLKQSTLCIMAISLCATMNHAQTGRRNPVGKSITSEKTTDIRNFDFKNFTYQSGDRGSIRLRNGKYVRRISPTESYEAQFDRVIYGDLTGDGNDEAVVVLTQEVSASSAEQYVYIYALKNGLVSKLTDFVGGTSGCVFEGEECSLLGIEIQGSVLTIDRAIPTDQDAKCCPSLHRSTKYRWDGGLLIEIGKTRIMRKA